MDRSADPCQDLYQYSCGGWMKNNPLPGDQSSWSVYGKLFQENQRYLWGILQDAAKPDPSRNKTQQKIGDFFDACMDVDAIETLGATPLAADLGQIDAMTSVHELGPILDEKGLLVAAPDGRLAVRARATLVSTDHSTLVSEVPFLLLSPRRRGGE